MTTSTHNSRKPPNPKQLALLSQLAQERGVTYARPVDRADAGRQIKRLLAMKRSPRAERVEDRDGVRSGFEDWGGATAVRDEEIAGHGSTARWA